jgi:polyphosphate glucokinase
MTKASASRSDSPSSLVGDGANRPGTGGAEPRILVVDVGGTHVKALVSGQDEPRKFESGPDLDARRMVDGVLRVTTDWPFDVVAIGYPGPVARDQILADPHNLAAGWVDYDFAGHFGRPTRILNDAAMQALGSYDGGRMLFLGLGTGLGSALVVEKVLVPLELAHLPYRKGKTYEDYLGVRGLELFGKKKWRAAVEDVVTRLKAALVADYVVLGGGNAKKLRQLPPDSRRGDNRHAFLGGFRIWSHEGYCHG